jgi:hypothetical protein
LSASKLCIECQNERDGAIKTRGGINRRGSKTVSLNKGLAFHRFQLINHAFDHPSLGPEGWV